ncbi:medium-chain acyl-CoA ligase ACSF2, mitochondrial-like [Glandiceps talaboti]
MACTTRHLTKSYIHQPGKNAFCGSTIDQLFDEHTTLYPDHEAIVFCKDNTRISYSKLRRDVLTLAGGFKSLSLRPGSRIGLWLDESYEFLISNLAAIRVGLIPALIPLKVTREHVCYIVNKVGCTALIVGPDQCAVLQEVCPEMEDKQSPNFHLSKLPSLRHVLVTSSKSSIEEPSMTDLSSLMTEGTITENVFDDTDPDDICLISFTSGSTGFPKAVAISQRAIIEASKIFGDLLIEISAGKGEQLVKMVVLDHFATAEIVFWEILLALNLMTLIFPKNKDVTTILSTIQHERCTTMYFWPHHAFDMINVDNIGSYDLSSLVKCVAIGGAIATEVLKKLSEVLSATINFVYGATESLIISFHSCKDQESKTSIVGTPVDNVEVKIVKDGKITDIKTPGEVCVRNPYLFTCYWGDEEKTKDVKTSAGWYHTGNIGTMDETGCLKLLGRKDDMIIKSATNIYPAEIEHQLVAYPGVKYVQIVPVPDMKFGNEICLCLCEDSSTQMENDNDGERHTKVLEYLRGRVPDFHLPKYVLTFDSFPRTESGKIKRNELAKAAAKSLNLNKN